MTGPAPDVFPCPVFEGSEKRISVTFAPRAAGASNPPPAAGLRTLTRNQLDAMLDLAACQIVSSRSNENFDAYVLSESSLFVYPDRMVLKTCGTTKLLSCVPYMCQLAAGVGLEPARVKYTRASFLFPEQQPAPHTSFEQECDSLKSAFAGLGSSSAYVLGDGLNGLQWHVFVAGVENAHATAEKPLYTLEVCMTGLAAEKASQFFRSDAYISAQHTTVTSGIQALVPDASIDDYVFEPCGYSMNGVEAGTFSTIHITPEDGFSYASFEICGYSPEDVNAAELVSKVSDVFRPRNLSVALSTDTAAPGTSCAAAAWGAAFMGPLGYACHSASYQEMKCGGCVAYFVLEQEPRGPTSGPGSPAAAAGRKAAASDSDGGSPRAVVKQFPSFSGTGSLASASVLADLDLLGSGPASDNASDNSSVRNGLCNSLLIDPVDMGVEDVLALHGTAQLPKSSPAVLDEYARKLIADHSLEDNFYILDLGTLQRLYRAWGEALPRVHPHYAVKCNPDLAVLATLAALGAGFDCASEAEVRAVSALGVPFDRIVFANPCKRPRDLRCMADRGVDLTTFDTEAELAKLARFAPGARALLRIRADDPGARCQLGNKYGAEVHEWESLLMAARSMGVEVAGVAFHVGSGATHPAAFSHAIELARRAWDLGVANGCDMQILDIGGGFCGGHVHRDGRVDMGGVPEAVNSALAAHFPENGRTRIIAEPGRFFSESIATMGCMVYGRRVRVDPGALAGAEAPAARAPGALAMRKRVHSCRRLAAFCEDLVAAEHEVLGYDYWVTDGLYGSMNSVLYDHATLTCRPLLSNGAPAPPEAFPSTVFGPTCDGLDTLLTDYELPELQVGDWLLFPSMGAYTLCGASKFNGIDATAPATFYVCSHKP
ncbi:ornithine decarboxylase [Micractinium conductrix]|uniref:Ornithine decarboxylase n=1 Tax=Micractinium conductrix TaxID=554055 RepID=A0A2P6V5T4_9CHLO|nr:ornithine decarboxylase [Micractinium conductrix]|eukprot:PSC69452.1 ornithine decarboxylase [Micractinium conductrix]